MQSPPTVDSPHHTSGKWLTVLVVGAAVICLAPVLLRVAAERGVGPVAVAFWRVALALPFLAGAALVKRRKRSVGPPDVPDRQALLFAAAAGACFGVDLMLYYSALVRTTMANATLLSNCAPIFVAIVAWLVLKERFGWLFVGGLLLAVGGAAVLSVAEGSAERTGMIKDAAERRFGDLLAITSAVFYAGYQLCIKRARRSLSMTKTFAVSLTASAVVLCSGALLLGERFTPYSGNMQVVVEAWAALVALGLVVQLGGQGSIVAALRHLPVSLSTVVLLAQPVSVAVLGWLLFNESLGPVHMLGAAGVLVGIYLARRGSAGIVQPPVALLEEGMTDDGVDSGS